MTTEQIDLASVKHLINSVWELKKQVQILSEKLTVSDNKNQELSGLVNREEERFTTEINQLKNSQLSVTQKQEQIAKQTIEQMTREYTDEKKSLIDGYEAKLNTTTTELQQRNDVLQKTIEKITHENQAIINRIRGIEQ